MVEKRVYSSIFRDKSVYKVNSFYSVVRQLHPNYTRQGKAALIHRLLVFHELSELTAAEQHVKKPF